MRKVVARIALIELRGFFYSCVESLKFNWENTAMANAKLIMIAAFVVVAGAASAQEPVVGVADPSRTYTTTWFDMWRFVGGKADEHWDPATK